ncbi:DUF4440 domain-containing protein [Qipengyuania zhejiangensis]|uniref:DUF4440 domain-containing protein n=1 Tax=Qipengyuania zhejiangensis TaxID=3077782 RepID=UPI002D76FABB|nr:DUF4440 domain-containing protein [Qipengyuania sp. Z2]
MLTSLVLAVFLAQATVPAPSTAQTTPVGEAMEAAIAANDAKLFWAFFEGCDPDAVADLIHPDYRMLHDLAGMPLSSGAQTIDQQRDRCARRAPGGAEEGYRNRRILVPGSRRIQKLGDWGALEEGHHTFYEWSASGNKGTGGWEMTGGGRYIHTWQWMPHEGRFRLLESLSIDHGAAAPYPPAPR